MTIWVTNKFRKYNSFVFVFVQKCLNIFIVHDCKTNLLCKESKNVGNG